MELGKDYLIYDKVLTCCRISEEFNSVHFVYKNNKTEEKLIRLFQTYITRLKIVLKQVNQLNY